MPEWRFIFTLPVAGLLALTAGLLALTVAPAAAEPALVRRADLAFAETAPGILREADRLRLWAMMRRETYDLPAPDVLQWQPEAEDPEGEEGWHQALEGQAITAQLTGRAEDWRALAGLAARAGERAAPEPLAREALGELAAGAATNALLLADTPGAVQRAVLALARLRVAGGDAETAARALATARRLPGLETDPALVALAAELDGMPRPAGPTALEEGQALRGEGWALGCANDLGCVASLAGPGVTLRLVRASGPGGAVHVTLILTAPGAAGAPLPQRPAGAPPILHHRQLLLDGEPFGEEQLPFRAAPDLFEGWAFWEVPPLHTDAALAALLAAQTLELRPEAGGGGAHLRLAGLAAALGVMDEVQGRVGTQTALVHRGPLSASAVTPPARLAAVPAPVEPDPGRALPGRPGPEALALWRALCPESREGPALAPVSTRSRDGAEIWLLHCGLQAGLPVFAAIHAKGGVAGALLEGGSPAEGRPPRPLRLGFARLGPLPVPGYGTEETRRPLALSAEAGGACPRREVFLWTGQGFARVSEARALDCAAPELISDLFLAVPKEE